MDKNLYTKMFMVTNLSNQRKGWLEPLMCSSLVRSPGASLHLWLASKSQVVVGVVWWDWTLNLRNLTLSPVQWYQNWLVWYPPPPHLLSECEYGSGMRIKGRHTGVRASFSCSQGLVQTIAHLSLRGARWGNDCCCCRCARLGFFVNTAHFTKKIPLTFLFY